MASTPETITLQLKAKHFEDTTFVGHCAAKNALIDHFKTHEVYMGVYRCQVLDRYYKVVTGYQSGLYHSDMCEARAANFDETVIRSIVLTPIQ